MVRAVHDAVRQEADDLLRAVLDDPRHEMFHDRSRTIRHWAEVCYAAYFTAHRYSLHEAVSAPLK
ncbi:hypothetical protein HLK59_13810 [Streptomyces sp. S3(2020)]|uniref:hypothetical protein n=1 Tax=Streptomyces sp. S3(2020) TaxID=2732044 RepID=UPI0014881DF1|nr:hypothetical protein [Streptomyces sp. S3(2020)]NNN31421.1 hypothetical protein [Streptomyces sp. S3(2020)]